MTRPLLLVSVVAIFTVSPFSSMETSAQRPAAPVVDSVDINGFRLVYRLLGQGEPLLLLHGFLQTGEQWSSVLDELAEQYRLIVPDLRGHGGSTDPSGRFTHRQAALDMFALMDHLNIPEVMAMGISSGGITLLHMATSRSDRIRAMVLIGAAAYSPEQNRAIQRASAPDDVPLEELASLGRPHRRGTEQARELLRQFSDLADNYEDVNFTPPFLSTILARTLIIHGDRDEFFPVSIPVEEYAAIPNSYLWIVPNGGHVPLLGTDRGDRVFLENVVEFLKGEWQ